MAIKTFNLPDPGEGLVEAEIVEWKVSAGDSVKVNDVVLEIETAKSLVELPIPWAGTVAQLLVEVGQTIDVGTPIISIDDGLGGDEAPAAAPSIPGERAQPADGEGAILVGYGAKAGATARRARKAPSGGGMPSAPVASPVASAPAPVVAAVPAPVAPVPAPVAPALAAATNGVGGQADGERWRAPQGQAARAQARQGPRRRPRGGHADRRRRRHHP